MLGCVAEPGSHLADARFNILQKTDRSRQEADDSYDSASQISGASTKKGLRQHLAEITDSMMVKTTSILKNESKGQK